MFQGFRVSKAWFMGCFTGGSSGLGYVLTYVVVAICSFKLCGFAVGFGFWGLGLGRKGSRV